MTHPISITQEQVTFVQHRFPVLNPGSYGLDVEQEIVADDPSIINAKFTTSRTFDVHAPRFVLQQELFHSCYPPNGGEGQYHSVMPQVVFSNAALPWLRRCDGNVPVHTLDDVAPWLFVLVLDDTFPITRSGTTTIADLQTLSHNPDADTFFPSFELEIGQTKEASCQYIDISVDSFMALMPTEDDLKSLAHVRSVTLNAKATRFARGQNTRRVDDEMLGDFSVTVANRMPQENKAYTACLVSLENYADYLNGTSFPAPTTHVRFVCFKEWQFVTVPDQKDRDITFTALAAQLNNTFTDISTLQLPCTDDSHSGVKNAFKMGYTAMNHLTRYRDKMASWYRGPLGTMAVKTTQPYPISCSDEALRYDPKTGLFDVSMSAAWQIGRLAALQSNAFASTLYTWKRNATQEAIKALEKQLMDQYISNTSRYFSRDAFNALVKSTLSDPSRLMTVMDNDPTVDILQWLARLHDLEGVPLPYLVPDARLLPEESIRFFQYDANWGTAVLDGAFSIGKSSTSDHSIDFVLSQDLLTKTRRHAGITRKQALRPWAEDTTHETEGKTVFSGFILRSELVDGWPGLETFGFGDTEGHTQLDLVRFDYLSGNIMIGLFRGDTPLQRVSIQEPSEGIFFEALDNKKRFRYLIDEPGKQIGEVNLDIDPIAIPFREHTPAKGVVDVVTLVATMEATLKAHNQLPDTEALTSDKFALEMMEGVEKVSFTTPTTRSAS